MGMHFRVVGERIVVFGQTFNHKDSLKALGARFNGVDKTWILTHSADNLSSLQALLSGASATEFPQTSSAASGLTVRQLVEQANLAVAQAFPNLIWVVGEIQNLMARQGSFFFNLCEGKEQAATVSATAVKATVWPSSSAYLKDRHGPAVLEKIFSDGMAVRLLCRVSMFKDRGQLSLSIEDVDPVYSEGALARARSKLIEKLRGQGLLDKNRALDFPQFPFRVGLVTAPQSRAYGDFTHQLMTQGFPGEVIFAAALMQGHGVPPSVTAAIAALVLADVDMIVITRGGGATADLSWFDDENVALAIAHSPVPVLAAIGHHEDTCVAEMVAYEREKTPTAAAEHIVQQFRLAAQRLEELLTALSAQLTVAMLDAEKQASSLKVSLSSSALAFLHTQEVFLNNASALLSHQALGIASEQGQKLSLLEHKVGEEALGFLSSLQEKLSQQQITLAGLDPTPWLKAGWTQLTHEGVAIHLLEHIKESDVLAARLMDGVVRMRVEKKIPR